MKYFNYLNDSKLEDIFYKQPTEFNKNSSKDVLMYSIGPLLYVPAIDRARIVNCLNNKIKGLTTMVICLEDAIGESGEEESIKNLKEMLDSVEVNSINEVPCIFIRPRNLEQIRKLEQILMKNKNKLTGIVIPKATGSKIKEFIEYLDSINCYKLYVMPIIETTEFINVQTKGSSLGSLYKVVNQYKDRVLNIRIGVTDILGSYGVRRHKELTIYDNAVFSSFSADILTLANSFDFMMPVSGSVSEFYNMNEKTIFDSYVKENKMDKLNGFIGKTVINPSQMKVVQAMNAISFEDYTDAMTIIENIHNKHSISASMKKERMNEVNPHLKWAKKILTLSEVFGVLNEGVTFNELYNLSLQN